MKSVLLASALALGLAAPALAQSTSVSPTDSNISVTGRQSGQQAVDDASILPPADGGVDASTTQSISPGANLPGANVPGSSNTSLVNSTTPQVGAPSTSVDGGLTPRAGGAIQGTTGTGTGVPGSTTAGPAAGGNGAF